MLFDITRNEETITFNLTPSEHFKVQYASFMQKDEILNQISRWDLKGKSREILRIKNIIHVNGQFLKQETPYLLPSQMDKLISDMMNLSLAYGILWIDTNIMGFNEIAVAKTAHNTTNIDTDVVEAIVKRIGDSGI